MRDTITWLVGIALVSFAAGMMIWSGASTAPLIVLGILGIVFVSVGARGRRSRRP